MRDPLNIALAVVALLLVLVGGRFAYERWQESRPVPGTVAAQTVGSGDKRVTLHVTGMMCATCVETITNALQATPGVKQCEVDRDAERAVILCDRATPDTTLVGAVVRSNTIFGAEVTAH